MITQLFQIFGNKKQILKYFYLKQRDHDEIKNFLIYLKEGLEDHEDFNEIFESVIEVGLNKLASSIDFESLKIILDENIDLLQSKIQIVLNNLFQSFVQGICYRNSSINVFEHCMDFFKEQGIELDIDTFNQILKHLDHYHKEEEFLEKIQIFANEFEFENDIVSMNFIMKILFSNCRFQKALNIYDNLTTMNFKPSHDTFQIVAKELKNIPQQIASERIGKFYKDYSASDTIKDIKIFNMIMEFYGF